jgi:hypothetical protein
MALWNLQIPERYSNLSQLSKTDLATVIGQSILSDPTQAIIELPPYPRWDSISRPIAASMSP